MLKDIVEWLRTASAIMAGSEHGHIARILFHPVECDLPSNMDARFSRTGMYFFPEL